MTDPRPQADALESLRPTRVGAPQVAASSAAEGGNPADGTPPPEEKPPPAQGGPREGDLHAPPQLDPDADLVAQAQAGAAGGFDSLVRRHQGAALGLACRLLGDREAALDAVQEAFLRAWRALGRFQGRSRFRTWLMRIVINQCRNDLRSRSAARRGKPLSLEALGHADQAMELPAPSQPVDARLEGEDLRRLFRQAFDRLDPAAREILLLREVEGLSYEEIGEILDLAPGTVRSRLHRAREVLRALLPASLHPAAVRTAPSKRSSPRDA